MTTGAGAGQQVGAGAQARRVKTGARRQQLTMGRGAGAQRTGLQAGLHRFLQKIPASEIEAIEQKLTTNAAIKKRFI